ncbi:hypothetical protein EV189_0634 [Motilibacter rhizosphaerae]|uniref:Uncharacterized protein n=1 Tax=Motilibacter rhizosphaerae TaxID=598652 RepID=A0A4Q7NVU0_9ACTN|nr:hypothetical protein [Motilibacter rhizosphaerae]RZS91393.1 hypothetical protein EV189_0634 [Motilibacter rhizosphaerae]
MSSIKTIPSEKTVRDALTGLLFRNCDLVLGGQVVHSATELATTAEYVDGIGTAAIIVADLSFSAYAGAAIGLVPKGGADDCIDEKQLFPNVKENFDEVLNVLASMFNNPGQPAVRLHKTYGLRELPPNDTLQMSRQTGRRLDLVVDIQGYGKGGISIVLI